MRIITGTARGVKLETLEGINTRPTSERAKEAIFSMIQFDTEGRRVLDLFAGSGQMALEALSRGAEFAVAVDSTKAAVEIIGKNAVKTKLDGKCRIVCADYSEYLRRASTDREKFDIVFLDPPYAETIIPRVLLLMKELNLLKPTSLIICETADGDVFTGRGGTECKTLFEVRKKAKYGVANVTLLTPISEE